MSLWRMVSGWLAALWAWSCGVHSPRHLRITVDDPTPAGPWWQRIPVSTMRRVPRVAGLMVGAAAVALLSVAPATVITGSAPANAEIFNTCMIMPYTVGEGPATAFDGTASMIPRMNMGYGKLTASDSTTDGTLYSTHQTVKEVKATATDGPRTVDSARTAWEVFGAGMNWTTVGFDAQGNARCSIIDSMITFAANGIFWLPRIVTDFTIKLKDFATGPSPLSAVYQSDTIGAGDDDTSNGVIANLRDSFMIAALTASIVVCGLWVLTKARGSDTGGNNTRTLVAGLTWSFMCALVAVTFLVGNTWWNVIKATDTGVAQANSVIADAMTKAVSDSTATCDDSQQNTNGGNCDVPQPVDDPCLLPSDSPNAGLRESSCAIYNTILFQPWALGEFGSDANNGAAMLMAPDLSSLPSHAYPSWESAKTDSGAATFWQWAGCGSLDKNGEYKLITDKSSWWWTTDDTERVIDAFSCISRGGLDQGPNSGCTIQSTLGNDACRDIRLVTLSIIGSNPYDYTRLGDTKALKAAVEAMLDSGNPLIVQFAKNLQRSIPAPPNLDAMAPDATLPDLRSSDISQRQLIAFTNYLGQGTTVDTTMRGSNGINRIGLAFMSLIVGLIMAVLIGYLSMLVLLWHVVTLMMVIILPVVAIFALPPPGMKLGMWWLREFVSSFILRFMYGVAITLTIVLIQAVTTAQMPLGLKLIVLALVIAALWTLVKEIRSGSLTPTFAGEKATAGNTIGRNLAIAGGVTAYAGWKARRPAGRVGRAAVRSTARRGQSFSRGVTGRAKEYKDYLRGASKPGSGPRGSSTGGTRSGPRGAASTAPASGAPGGTATTTGTGRGVTPTARGAGAGAAPRASTTGGADGTGTGGDRRRGEPVGAGVGSAHRQVVPGGPPEDGSTGGTAEQDLPSPDGRVAPTGGTRSRVDNSAESGELAGARNVAPGDAPLTPAGGQRPAPSSGTRSTTPDEAQAAPAGGQRPAVPGDGTRPAPSTGGQRPAVPGDGTRPAPSTGGQRPSGAQTAGGDQRGGTDQPITPQRNGRKTQLCMRCKGTGRVKDDRDGGEDTISCPVCNGRGRVYR